MTEVFPDEAADLHACCGSLTVAPDGTGIFDIRLTSSVVGAWQLKNSEGRCTVDEMMGKGDWRNCVTKSAGLGKSTFCNAEGISSPG
jgi:hypothetical protein